MIDSAPSSPRRRSSFPFIEAAFSTTSAQFNDLVRRVATNLRDETPIGMFGLGSQGPAIPSLGSITATPTPPPELFAWDTVFNGTNPANTASISLSNSFSSLFKGGDDIGALLFTHDSGVARAAPSLAIPSNDVSGLSPASATPAQSRPVIDDSDAPVPSDWLVC
jgi:hypothetical protein